MKSFKCLSWVVWMTTISGENCCHLILAAISFWADSEGEGQAGMVGCFVFRTKTNCLKNLKPFKWRPRHCNASGDDFGQCWKSLWEDALYGSEVSKGKSSSPCRTTVLCITRITLNLFGPFMGLIRLRWSIYCCWAADSESLTLSTLAKKGTYLLLREAWQWWKQSSEKSWNTSMILSSSFCVKDNWKSAEDFLYSKSRINRKVIEWLF